MKTNSEFENKNDKPFFFTVEINQTFTIPMIGSPFFPLDLCAQTRKKKTKYKMAWLYKFVLSYLYFKSGLFLTAPQTDRQTDKLKPAHGPTEF